MKAGITADPDTDVCVGGGLGAILVTCKETVGGETDADGGNKFKMKASTADSTSELSNSFSIAWSYTTSSNPAL